MPPKGKKRDDAVGKTSSNNKARDPWLCISCTNTHGARWRNGSSALQCGKCKKPKGQCFGEKAVKGGSPTVSSKAAALAKHPASEGPKVKQLLAEIANLKKKAAEASSSKEVEKNDCSDPGDSKEEERTIRVKQLNADLKAFRAVPEDCRGRLGIATKILQLEAERDSLLKARREARPADERLLKAQAWEKSMADKAKKADEKAEELHVRKQ